ncbi:DNA repair protein RecN [Rubidibacter lacunae KORDI 51-2]|uniref:DNA repair protein RecN n=1 Tax=Rubidibacter lacunae KORDI 51-2 TaxID=582515 RepID=U5D8U3_9CHRO|nr:DNA repair protein RecN [Rubidibacter lacunae]ERN41018.1 DNA repair protein RecN [Rubidibacter lacunae KORDI 51-2]
MLVSLAIENFALIDRLDLDFGTGLNVLTGETGAGKSIILDAIDAALGGKATGRFLRTGADRAAIEATFRITPAIASWLDAQEIDRIDEESLVCGRELALGKRGVLRSRSRVNGVLVNRCSLGELRALLLDVTAQGQTGELMQPARQRELLDRYGGDVLQRRRAAVAKAWEHDRAAQNALDRYRQSEQSRLQRLDLLQYQLQELDATDLGDPDELDELLQERDRLAHVVELQQLAYQGYSALYQDESGEAEAAADVLARAEDAVADMARFDSQVQPLLELVQSAIAQVVEAGRQVSAYAANLEADPERFDEVETRTGQLKQICRKYGPTLSDAITLRDRLQAELDDLTVGGRSLDDLERAAQDSYDALTGVCAQLSRQRRTAARRLEKQLIAELAPLGMEKVRFECALEPQPPSANGADRVEFRISPNPGEGLKPLAETASGGEMSRFLLALKACFSQTELGAGTLIFDEIDTGVSGRVASAIGETLHQLARRHQVLCVTHQPLIAAMADAHFRVAKEVMPGTATDRDKTVKQARGKAAAGDRERTVVRVTALDRATRRDELAQLAGGHSGEDAIAFAESLLAQARSRQPDMPSAAVDRA